MKKFKDIYLHKRAHATIVNFEPTDQIYIGGPQRYQVVPGLLLPNNPFAYHMEFRRLCSTYYAVEVKLLRAPVKELVDVRVLLDGEVFEDLLKRGQAYCTGSAVELEETLVFKHKGTMKLCRS
jgi:hypothetical protein